MTTPKLPPLPEQIKALIDAEMAEYRDGAYSDHSSARDQLERFAYAIAAIQAQGVPDVVQEWKSGVISAQEAMLKIASSPPAPQAKRCKVCNYQHGHQIGCENNPVDIALKALASVVQQEPTDEQIMATVGRKCFGFSESRPLAQQWDLVCELIRAVIRERYTHPAQQAKPQPLSDEQDRALCEAYCNTASDEYFKARPQLDSDVNRRIFYAGHRKAWINWQAAHGIKE